MIVWIILSVILIIILIFMMSPVRIFVDYQNGKTNMVVKYLFIKKNLNQLKKRDKSSKNKKNANEKENARKNSKLKNIIPEDTESKIEFVLNLLKSGGKSVKHITRHISVKKIYIDFIISDLDAYECALKFGKTNIIVYNILAYLGCFIKLKKKSIDIKCVYNQPECSYNANFMIKLTPVIGISTFVVFIFTFLVNNKSIKKAKSVPQT